MFLYIVMQIKLAAVIEKREYPPQEPFYCLSKLEGQMTDKVTSKKVTGPGS